MEAVFANAGFFVVARDRVAAYRRREIVVERRIETADLQQRRPQFPHGADDFDGAGLVQGSERRQAVDSLDGSIVEHGRRSEFGPAMNDSMADTEKPTGVEVRLEPFEHLGQHRAGRRAGWPRS